MRALHLFIKPERKLQFFDDINLGFGYTIRSILIF